MTEREFINYWKNIDFSMCNESDVREDFIAPLLNLLGYSKNTINNIVREKTLQLTEPLQRLGRKRVQIDYVPTIRLKAFWILEAKPGNIKEMDVGDLLQAYLYATHPEIQAQYIVLCNGWTLMIYDVFQVEDWKNPIFKITQDDCQDNFYELREILSAKTMLEHRRKRLLYQIQNTFEVELDVKQWNSFVSEINRMNRPLELKINENVKELQRKDFKEKEKRKKESLQNADDKTLLGWMTLSGPRTAELYLEYYRRIKQANETDRAKLLRMLMQTYWSRCHAEFKCDCLAILFLIVENQLIVAGDPFLKEPKSMLCEIIEGNLTYHKRNSMQNALDYLDKYCCKFAYLVMKNSLMGTIAEKVTDRKLNMAIEELVIERPTVAREMVKLINICTDYLWMYLSNENSPQNIWINIRVLDYLIQTISNVEIPKYPDGDSDLLWYDSYGDKFDYLFRVTYMFANNHKSVVNSLEIDENIKEIIFADESSAMKFIPKMPIAERELSEEEMKEVLQKILFALIKTGECWHDLERD